MVEDAPEGCPVQISSIVQNRGSIPLFWSQETSRLNLKPDITRAACEDMNSVFCLVPHSFTNILPSNSVIFFSLSSIKEGSQLCSHETSLRKSGQKIWKSDNYTKLDQGLHLSEFHVWKSNITAFTTTFLKFYLKLTSCLFFPLLLLRFDRHMKRSLEKLYFVQNLQMLSDVSTKPYLKRIVCGFCIGICTSTSEGDRSFLFLFMGCDVMLK